MGYELRRWLADRLPAELSSGERLVALEIADQANEKTRRAFGKAVLATIVRRTGYADEKQLGKVLGKLAAHGIELRVPMRRTDGQVVVDKRGYVMFACNTHALEFLIPTTETCPALKVPRTEDLEGLPNGGASDVKAPPVGPEGPPPGAEAPPIGGAKGPPPGPEGPPLGGPFSSDLLSSSPQEISSSLSLDQEAAGPGSVEREMNIDPLTQRLMNEHQATEDEVEDVIDSVRREGVIRSIPAWASSDIGRADFARRLADHRRYVTAYRAWDDYEEVAPAPDGSLAPPGPPPWLQKNSNGSGPRLAPQDYSNVRL